MGVERAEEVDDGVEDGQGRCSGGFVDGDSMDEFFVITSMSWGGVMGRWCASGVRVEFVGFSIFFFSLAIYKTQL